ncbi:uncharacterized protein LOC144436076 [Glandiceps talaboti]
MGAAVAMIVGGAILNATAFVGGSYIAKAASESTESPTFGSGSGGTLGSLDSLNSLKNEPEFSDYYQPSDDMNLGEACSHFAAVLFALEDFVAQGYRNLVEGPACTEVLCKWIAKRDSRVTPKPMSEIPIYKPEHGKEKRDWGGEASGHDGRSPCQQKVDYYKLLHLRNRLLNNDVKVSACNSLALDRYRPQSVTQEMCTILSQVNQIQTSQDNFIVDLTFDDTWGQR